MNSSTFLLFLLSGFCFLSLTGCRERQDVPAVDMEFRVADDAAARVERVSKERFLGGMEGVGDE